MSEQDIYKKIEILIKERQGEDFQVTPSLAIRDDLGADSVDLMEFIITLEDEFAVDIPDEAADQLFSLQDVVAYIQEQKR